MSLGLLVPLQFGAPGALEIIVIILIAVILLGVPLLVLLGVASGLTLLGADDEDIEALRERVNELEAQLAEKNAERYEDDGKN